MDGKHTILRPLAKVAGTSAAVAAIGLAIVTLSPGDDGAEGIGVEESEADILWMSSAGPTNTQKFAESLERLGHGRPRVFTLNGNDVYVSDRTTRRTPSQVLYKYQHQFAARGLNSKVRTKTMRQIRKLDSSEAKEERLDEMSEAAMNGEIMPGFVSEKKVTMFGLLRKREELEQGAMGDKLERAVEDLEQPIAELRRLYGRCGGDPAMIPTSRQVGGTAESPSARLKAKNRMLDAFTRALMAQPKLRECRALRGWLRNRTRQGAAGFSDQIDAFRSIKAIRDEERGLTHVTATWSKRGFQMGSVMDASDGAEGKPAIDPKDFPLCQGCQLEWNFSGSGAERSFANQVVKSRRSVPAVAAEYRHLLKQKGWEPRPDGFELKRIQRVLDFPETDQQSLRFTRGSRHMTVTVRPTEGASGSTVTAVRSD